MTLSKTSCPLGIVSSAERPARASHQPSSAGATLEQLAAVAQASPGGVPAASELARLMAEHGVEIARAVWTPSRRTSKKTLVAR